MMANKSYSYFFAAAAAAAAAAGDAAVAAAGDVAVAAAAAAAGDAACAPLFAAVAPLTPPVGMFDNKATDNLLIIRYEMILVNIDCS